MAVFKLPNGDTIEVFGPADQDHRYFTTGPVPGFAVDDRLARSGATIVAALETSMSFDAQAARTRYWHARLMAPTGNADPRERGRRKRVEAQRVAAGSGWHYSNGRSQNGENDSAQSAERLRTRTRPSAWRIGPRR
jgi:hypothetical protein